MGINKIRNNKISQENNSEYDNYKLQEIFKYIVEESDKERYSKTSKEVIKCQCVDCDTIKEYRMCDLWNNGFSCSKCGDGVSFGEKLMYSFLEQLRIDFDIQYTADWTKNRRYDFYFKLNGKEHVVEMDGAFHYTGNKMSGMTREEINAIDDEKDKLAEDNNVNMIRINSRVSTINYIRDYILESDLNELFDLSNMDWFKCGEYTATSIMKWCCNLWNEGNTIMQIRKVTKRNIDTIRKYLLRGKELNICTYDPTNSRQVICLNTKEIFKNGRDAGNKLGIFIGNINANCKGRANSAGKDPTTGESLKWMFYDKYLELSVDEQNKPITKTIKTINKSGVICLDTMKIFKIITQAGKFYNISSGNITDNARGRTSYAGKLSDGTPLRWMYYDEYLKEQEAS